LHILLHFSQIIVASLYIHYNTILEAVCLLQRLDVYYVHKSSFTSVFIHVQHVNVQSDGMGLLEIVPHPFEHSRFISLFLFLLTNCLTYTTSKKTLFKYIHKIMEWVSLKYKKYILY